MIINIVIILFKLLLYSAISYVVTNIVAKIIIKNKPLNIKNIDKIIDIEHYDIKKNNNEKMSNNIPTKYKENI